MPIPGAFAKTGTPTAGRDCQYRQHCSIEDFMHIPLPQLPAPQDFMHKQGDAACVEAVACPPTNMGQVIRPNTSMQDRHQTPNPAAPTPSNPTLCRQVLRLDSQACCWRRQQYSSCCICPSAALRLEL